jgi:Zn-dependent peptidase ImmA (M78 family)
MDETEVRYRGRRFVVAASPLGTPDLEAYAKKVTARLRYESLPRGESGYTVKTGNGFVITVNSEESKERQRFTVCHEVAHIALELPTMHGEVPSWSYAKRHLNEVWCDIFASELLMPYEAFRKKIPDGDPTQETIESLAREFGASFPATSSRYASLAPFPCAYATMEAGMIRYAEANAALRSKGLRIHMKQQIPPGSVAHRLRAAAQNSVDAGQIEQDIWFENCEAGYEMWELSRHYGEYDQTVSVLWCSEDDLPHGEIDRFHRLIDEDEGEIQELTGEISWEKPGPRRK